MTINVGQETCDYDGVSALFVGLRLAAILFRDLLLCGLFLHFLWPYHLHASSNRIRQEDCDVLRTKALTALKANLKVLDLRCVIPARLAVSLCLVLSTNFVHKISTSIHLWPTLVNIEGLVRNRPFLIDLMIYIKLQSTIKYFARCIDHN